MLRLALAVLAAGAATTGCVSTDTVSISGRRQEESIRQQLLAHTPPGTHVRDVVTFINRRLKHEGGRFPAAVMVNHPLVPSSGAPRTRFEHQYIPDLTPRFTEHWQGETLDIEIVTSIHQGLPFRVWTGATWQFGRDGLLLDIIVKKNADGL